MDLFTLSAKLTLDTSEFNNNVDGAEQKGSTLGNTLSTVGSVAAKGLATAGAAATAAIGAVSGLAKSAIEAYANYEQLTGGIETLFGDSADIVMQYAQNAYQTAGLSANDYMEQVTSFSASLLQSCAGDTAEAARVADMAMTDMSDNANKMGTSMESIQNAYQGFAKGNYTMLDNLKLGYGGTAAEMKRLLSDAQKLTGVKYDINNLTDVYEAIHVIQEELGITGTTAEEASTTIQGSLSMTQAAWENLKVALVDPNGNVGEAITNLIDSAKTAFSNLLPAIKQALTGIGEAVAEVAPVIAAELPGLISEVLPDMISAATSLIDGFITAITESAPTIIEGGIQIVSNIAQAIVDNLDKIIDAAGQILDAIITVFKESDSPVLNAIGEVLETIKNVLSVVIDLFTDFPAAVKSLKESDSKALNLLGDALEVLEKVFNWIKDNYELVAIGIGAIVAAFEAAKIVEFVSNLSPVTIVLAAIAAAALLIASNWEEVKATVIQIWNDIETAVTNAWDAVKEWLVSKAEDISAAWGTIGQWFADTVWTPIQDAAANAWTAVSAWWEDKKSDISAAWSTVGTWFKDTVWEPLKNAANNAWSAVAVWWEDKKSKISDAWSTVGTWFKNTVWTPLQNAAQDAWDVVTAWWEDKKSDISAAWSTVGSWFKSTIWEPLQKASTDAWTAVSNWWQDKKSAISGAWSTVGDWFKNTVWTPVQNAATNAWNAVKDWWETNIGGKLEEAWASVYSVLESIINPIRDLFQGVWDVAVGIYNAICDILGLNGSTSDIYVNTHYNSYGNPEGNTRGNTMGNVDHGGSIGGAMKATEQAIGDWNVPYDEFPALLHRGEMVLTATNARHYRENGAGEGGDYTGLVSAIVEAVREGISGATVNSYLDGRAITDEVSRIMGSDLTAGRFAT